MSAVGGTATTRVSMCGAAASCSIALNVCQILEIDLEKLLRGGNSISGQRRTARSTHPPGVGRLSDRCNDVAPKPPSGWRSQLGVTTSRLGVTAFQWRVTTLQRSAPTRVPDGNTFHSSSVSGAPTSGSGARSGSGKEVSQPLVETQQRAPDRPKSRSRSAKCLIELRICLPAGA